MSRLRILRNAGTGDIVLGRAKMCDSYWCRLRGLQFVFNLEEDEGLIFAEAMENKVVTTIHMLFMFMEIGVVWLDTKGNVVDKQLAKPWRLAYVPKSAARYYVEAQPSILERVEIGDMLKFDEEVD